MVTTVDFCLTVRYNETKEPGFIREKTFVWREQQWNEYVNF